MLTIEGYITRLLNADQWRRAAAHRGDEMSEAEALLVIDDNETCIARVQARNAREAMMQNLVLIGRLRRIAQDEPGGLEHEAEQMAERLLDFTLQSTGLECPADLRAYVDSWIRPTLSTTKTIERLREIRESVA